MEITFTMEVFKNPREGRDEEHVVFKEVESIPQDADEYREWMYKEVEVDAPSDEEKIQQGQKLRMDVLLKGLRKMTASKKKEEKKKELEESKNKKKKAQEERLLRRRARE